MLNLSIFSKFTSFFKKSVIGLDIGTLSIKAVEILKEKRSKLDLIAETLMKQETIDGEEFEKLMKS